MMYLLIWTITAEWPGMISLGIKSEDIPRAQLSIANTNTKIRGRSRNKRATGLRSRALIFVSNLAIWYQLASDE